MDAAGFGRIYEEDDKADDYLLNEPSAVPSAAITGEKSEAQSG